MQNSKEDILEAIKWLEGMRDTAVVVLDSGFGDKTGEDNSVYVRRKRLAEIALDSLYVQLKEFK